MCFPLHILLIILIGEANTLLQIKKYTYIFILLSFLISVMVGCANNTPQTQEKETENNQPKNTAVTYPVGRVYTADQNGNSVSVIDTTENKVVKSVEVKSMPHNVQISPNGKEVWVVVAQPGVEDMSGMNHGDHGDHGSGMAGQLWVIDTTNSKITHKIDIGSDPAHVILTPNSKEAYVSNGGDNTVSVVDTSTYKVTATVDVGEGPHGLRPSPDGKVVVVANANVDTVSIIDTVTKKVTNAQVGNKPAQVAFDPDGKRLYISLMEENAVAVVNTDNWQTTKTISVGKVPIQLYVTPDNKYVYVANQGTSEDPDNRVSVIDTEKMGVTKTIETGKGAHGVVVSDDGKFAYITNLYDNTVSVIDIVKNEVVKTIEVGEGPNGITFKKQ